MRAVFLDRDGVINEDRDDYVKTAAELVIFPHSAAAIRRLNDAGWPVLVISNQQGVAKGLISEDDLQAIGREIDRRVSSAGGKIDAFYYCRHLAADECSCRKPQPGLILKAAKDHGIELAESFMVGDNERDIIAGKSAGCRTVLVLTGKLTRRDAENIPCKPDFIADNLAQAAEYIVGCRTNAEASE